MIRTAHVLPVAVLLLFTACGADDDALDTLPGDDTADLQITPDTGMRAGGMATTFTLQPAGAGSVSGEATLSEAGGRTEVLVRLTGSTPDATHQGHIHQGTCDNVGSVVAPLEPVETDDQGSGTSTSAVDVPITTAANGQHLIAYHEAGGSPGAPVTCGEIPSHGM